MKSSFNKTILFTAVALAMALSANATTVSITFVGAPTGVSDGAHYVLPYQLNIAGQLTPAICYDLLDNVTSGQIWTANELNLTQAATAGQFSTQTNALASYEKVGFLSQQTASSPQNQIDLQHDIWNIFAPNTFSVSTGMKAYLDLLTTSAFTNFNFDQIRFLEDVNQTTGRSQAFVIDPPTATPEPGTGLLMGAGVLLVILGRVGRTKRQPREL